MQLLSVALKISKKSSYSSWPGISASNTVLISFAYIFSFFFLLFIDDR